MADSFLHRWLGRSPHAEREDYDGPRAELDRLAAARPDLLPLMRWLREMLPELAPASSAPVLSLQRERAHSKLKEGIPLLRDEPVVIDATTFRLRWQQACRALQAQPSPFDGVEGSVKRLADALRDGRIDPGELTDRVLAGRPEMIRGRAQELGLDPGLAMTLLRFTLFPLFTAIAVSLDSLRAGVAWEHGYCPTCGSWPLLGEFRGLDQARLLRCGLCASGWDVPRLWCPFCGNRDHERLGFLHKEGEDTKYRASLCDACRGYVKMVSTLAALEPLPLLVADAATLHLDLAAAERGYVAHA